MVPGMVFLDLCTLFYLNEMTRSSPALFGKKKRYKNEQKYALELE
jgi:hypothetical protein